VNQDESLLHEIMPCTIPPPTLTPSGSNGNRPADVDVNGAAAGAAYSASFEMPPDSPVLFPVTPSRQAHHERNIAALPSLFK